MSEQPTAEEKVSILLVDDRPGNLVSLKGVLERPDYELVLAQSGEEALQQVLKREFALILLDVAMPRMDGFEVAKVIKQRDRFKAIPIIFVTASVQNIEWIFEAYSVGAVDFLPKPIDPHAVRAKVAVFVELFRQRQLLKRQALLLRESERRTRELQIAELKVEQERRYRTLAEAVPHIIWTAKASGAIEYFNHRWFTTTGLSKEQSLGSGWRSALHPDDRAELTEQWSAALRNGAELQIEVRLKQADGSHRWHLLRALPEENAEHRVESWLGTFTDVDEQRRAHDESRAAVRLRDEFLSVAAHELRTPLTSLQLQLQAVRREAGRDTSSQEPWSRVSGKIDTAVRQVRRLATLVNSLLDVSRIAVGRLELQLEEFDLCALAREVLDRFQEEAATAKCELRLAGCEQVVGVWDRLRVDQLLSNLVSNAIKYAPGTPVDVRLEDGEEGPRVRILDRGIGIPPEDVERIFGRFERAVSSRHYGGLGLGLYIAQQIAHSHGGTITLESEPGKGSVFTIALPWRTAQLHLPEAKAGLPAEAH